MNSITGPLPWNRRIKSGLGIGVLGVAAFGALIALSLLLLLILREGLPAISWQFLSGFPSRRASTAGIWPGIVGTLYIGVFSMVVAVPVGVLAAVYLNEFAPENRTTTVLRAAIANLAGVPSIVFGILGLALFVRALELGTSVAAAGMTLGLLTLPIVIVVSQESLKTVPRAMREAAFAVGATPWQVVRHHVLPYSLPGMLTASILALSRTMGETAPLILIGASAYLSYVSIDPSAEFTALPIQAYNWAFMPQEEFHTLAWGTVLVLVMLVLVGNLAAILLRDRFQKRYRW